MTYLKKNLAVIAAVDRTLVLVFKLSMSSMTRLTREFGIIESFGSIIVIEPIENVFPAPKGDENFKLSDFNELNDKATAKFDIWPAFMNLT